MKFSIPPDKDFKEDIIYLHNALRTGENVSFSKFCDGEWAVIQNIPLNNTEFYFDPSKEEYQNKRQELINALQYKNDQYFVGITCVNVFGLDIHRNMKKLSGQDEDHLTWADVWVNSNYKYYLYSIMPIYKQRQIVLVANRRGNIGNLPFKPYHTISIENNAWTKSDQTLEEAKNLIDKHHLKNAVFLFCAGPLGNILCHRLTEFNKENTYLDIGSTLNPFLQCSGFERDYYMGNNYFSQMIGAWDQ